jgi:hypothetical protein
LAARISPVDSRLRPTKIPLSCNLQEGERTSHERHTHISSQGSTEQRNCQATITKGFKGYTVTVTIRETGEFRVLVDKTVETYHEAETIARAFASQRGFPWNKVAVVSK